MPAGVIQRHYRKSAGLIVALATVVYGLTGMGTASAASQALTQTAPFEGATLVGSAFNDQLAVTGATGTVTFAQTSGSDVTVSSTGAVTAPGTLAAGTYTATGSDSDPSGDTGTWTYTLSVLNPAPSGFDSTMVDVYQSEYNVAAQLGQGSSVESVPQYQQAVSQLTPGQLALVYNATQQDPEWYQIPSLMQTVGSDVSPPLTGTATTNASIKTLLKMASVRQASAAKAAAPKGTKPSSSAAKTHGAGLSAGVRAGVSTGVVNQDDLPPVAPFTPSSCPSEPPDAAVFALQIVIDVTQGLYNALAATAIGITDLLDIQLPTAIAAVVAAGVLLAAQITHDVLAFEQLQYSECQANNLAGQVNNIDSTTVQTYTLLASLGTTAAQIETTTNTTLTDVQDLLTNLQTVQNTLVQTINSDTSTLQTTIGSDTQNVVSELQTDINGLQTDVTNVDNDVQSLNQKAITETDTDTNNIQSSLSTDLNKILSETDSDAANITNLITTDNQQVMNTLQSNFSTQQTEYYQNLTLWIENALAEWGPIVPEVQLELPASQGGLLNSTPVGVQSVVTNALNAVIANGGKATASATNDLKAANAALAAGQYLTAYQDYADCYEAFA